ncbi:MAG: hypothetical protein HY054_04990 [Proteobacteria bacterium]|nr:hypothetical protein [Pseudomonadota bacterium]
MIRALFAALVLLSACAAPAPPRIYPEAELAPGNILAPIRAAMGDQIAFTNARVVSEGVMEVEGARADGAYEFTVTQQGDRWVLTNTERTGLAP